MSLAVANQYAKALLDVVAQPGSQTSPEEALAQLQAFDALIGESSELRSILLSPAVAMAQKSKAIRRLCTEAGLGKAMANFLCVVTSHRRIALLGKIEERFQAQLDEQLGLTRAEVSAARALSAGQQGALEAKLASMAGRGVRCAYTVDGELLGGVTVKIGSKVLDGSVRGRLEALRRRLASAV